MQEKDFVSYEYRTVSVKAKDQTKAMDMYEAFGWEITATEHAALDNTILSMKRDRKLKHKAELVKLERQAENAFDAVNCLEKAKTRGARVFAYVFGCIATLVLGGGMCLCMLTQSAAAMAAGIVVGIVGIALCAVNYPVFKKLVVKKTKSLLPVIDETEENLANIIEKGNDLLNAELI